MITLTYEQAVADLQAVVEGREDFVYTPLQLAVHVDTPFPICAYFDPETAAPSCGIGHVLARHGLTYDDLGYLNIETNVENLVDEEVLSADERTVELLSAFQSFQDVGTPWGKALAGALDGRHLA
jgi:hypothetical protein